MALKTETGRDRHFKADDREFAAPVDPAAGTLAEQHARIVDCPARGSTEWWTLSAGGRLTVVDGNASDAGFSDTEMGADVIEGQVRMSGSDDLRFDFGGLTGLILQLMEQRGDQRLGFELCSLGASG